MSDLVKNLNTIQTSLSTNVETISELLGYAKTLIMIAEKLRKEKKANPDLVDDLITEIHNLHVSIEKLINETNTLFDLHEDVSQEIFRIKK